ncbi:hypothetical protein ACWEPC_47375 [Nonomuraea sp. NPDC004297]
MISGSPLVRGAAKNWFRLCRNAPALRRLTFGGNWTDTTAQEPERHAVS